MQLQKFRQPNESLELVFQAAEKMLSTDSTKYDTRKDYQQSKAFREDGHAQLIKVDGCQIQR